MKKKAYKVEFLLTQTFCVDAIATSEEEAKKLAKKRLDNLMGLSMEHYYKTGEEVLEVHNVYDVSGTDDDPRENK